MLHNITLFQLGEALEIGFLGLEATDMLGYSHYDLGTNFLVKQKHKNLLVFFN